MALFTIEWVGNMYGADKYYSVKAPEGTSETFKKGAPVIYDVSESGIVEVTRTSGVPDNDDMYGIALEDASGTAQTVLDVLIPRPGDIFSAMLASAAGTLVAPDEDNIGVLYELVKLSTAATNADGQAAAGTEYAVIEDAAGEDTVQILTIDPRDIQRRNGDLGAWPTMSKGDRVLFTFTKVHNAVTVGSQA